MIDSAGFTDLRNYIKRRVAYAKYRVGNTYIKTDLSDVAVLPNGTVRAQLTISAESTPLTVTRVELYNSDKRRISFTTSGSKPVDPIWPEIWLIWGMFFKAISIWARASCSISAKLHVFSRMARPG